MFKHIYIHICIYNVTDSLGPIRRDMSQPKMTPTSTFTEQTLRSMVCESTVLFTGRSLTMHHRLTCFIHSFGHRQHPRVARYSIARSNVCAASAVCVHWLRDGTFARTHPEQFIVASRTTLLLQSAHHGSSTSLSRCGQQKKTRCRRCQWEGFTRQGAIACQPSAVGVGGTTSVHCLSRYVTAGVHRFEGFDTM